MNSVMHNHFALVEKLFKLSILSKFTEDYWMDVNFCMNYKDLYSKDLNTSRILQFWDKTHSRLKKYCWAAIHYSLEIICHPMKIIWIQLKYEMITLNKRQSARKFWDKTHSRLKKYCWAAIHYSLESNCHPMKIIWIQLK